MHSLSVFGTNSDAGKSTLSLHEIFENDAFRYKIFHTMNKDYNFKEFKQKAIAEFTEHIAFHVTIDAIEKALKE